MVLKEFWELFFEQLLNDAGCLRHHGFEDPPMQLSYHKRARAAERVVVPQPDQIGILFPTLRFKGTLDKARASYASILLNNGTSTRNRKPANMRCQINWFLEKDHLFKLKEYYEELIQESFEKENVDEVEQNQKIRQYLDCIANKLKEQQAIWDKYGVDVWKIDIGNTVACMSCLAAIIWTEMDPLDQKESNIVRNLQQRLKFEISGYIISNNLGSGTAIPNVTPTPYFLRLWQAFFPVSARDSGKSNDRNLLEIFTPPVISSSRPALWDTSSEPEIIKPLSNQQFAKVLIGSSGYGKTTTMKAVTLSYIAHSLFDEMGEEFISLETLEFADCIKKALSEDVSPKECFPVFIEAASVNKRQYADILDLAVGQAVPDFRTLVNQAIYSDSLLLLVDALDEIQEKDRKDTFLRKLKEFQAKHPSVSVFMTSRYLDTLVYDPEYTPLYILPFDEKRIQQLLQTLSSDTVKFEKIWNRINTNPYLKEIYSNPYMMSHASVKSLDRQYPHDLLEDILNQIILRREQYFSGFNYRGADRDALFVDLILLLSYTALDMVRKNATRLLKQDLERNFVACFNDLRDKEKYDYLYHEFFTGVTETSVRNFAKAMSCQSGILTLEEEDGREYFVFQEKSTFLYLAGKALADQCKRCMEPTTAFDEPTVSSLMLIAEQMGDQVSHQTKLLRTGSHLTENQAGTIMAAVCSAKDNGQRSQNLNKYQKALIQYLLVKGVLTSDEETRKSIKHVLVDILFDSFGKNPLAHRLTYMGDESADTMNNFLRSVMSPDEYYSHMEAWEEKQNVRC